MSSRAGCSLSARLDRSFLDFFEKAERERRWSSFDDVPWDALPRGGACAELGRAVSSFWAAKASLPPCIPESLGAEPGFCLSAFLADWAYEESKHLLALREWLERSGTRSREELAAAYASAARSRGSQTASGTMRRATVRAVAFRGCLQETASFVACSALRDLAVRHGDACLRTIADFVARDEIAHARFCETLLRCLLEDDREATVVEMADLATELELVELSGPELAFPGLVGERDAWSSRVLGPVLRRLGVTHEELLRAPSRAPTTTALAPRSATIS